MVAAGDAGDAGGGGGGGGGWGGWGETLIHEELSPSCRLTAASATAINCTSIGAFGSHPPTLFVCFNQSPTITVVTFLRFVMFFFFCLTRWTVAMLAIGSVITTAVLWMKHYQSSEMIVHSNSSHLSLIIENLALDSFIYCPFTIRFSIFWLVEIISSLNDFKLLPHHLWDWIKMVENVSFDWFQWEEL